VTDAAPRPAPCVLLTALFASKQDRNLGAHAKDGRAIDGKTLGSQLKAHWELAIDLYVSLVRNKLPLH
jgi:hypothetical protein